MRTPYLQIASKWLVSCATMALMPLAQAQGLPTEVASAWQKTQLPLSSASFVIEEVGGKRIAAHEPATMRNPASVMKLVTTWAALSDLGPEFVWRTAFLKDADSTISQNGVLSGNLYLRPSGDPVLLLEDLWRLMRDLRLRGIQQIGDLVIDRGLFADVTIDPGEFDGKPDRPYNASPDVFMVGFGAVRVVFTPDEVKKQWQAFFDPPLPGMDVESELQWIPGACNPAATKVELETVTAGNEVRFRATGKAAGSCGEFDLYRLAFDQPTMAAKVLRHMWTEIGGKMTGQVRDGRIPSDALPVVAYQSPPLAEVIRLINKRSNNVMTRSLLLTIGARSGLRPATVQGSVDRVQSVLRRQGLDFSKAVIENGSGLSRRASVSADLMTAMLQKAWASPAMPEYLASMAIMGVDGTLTNRLKNTPARGYANMKTGALRDARAIAGYVLSRSGKRYIFVSLVNDPQAFKAREFENAVVQWLVEKQ